MLPCMAGPAEPCPESASGNGGLLGDRAEDQQLLQSQLKDWVMRADLNTRLARHTQRGGDEAIILQADVMQICYDSPGLATSMMINPEHVRVALISLLVCQWMMPNILQRLWLRCTQVPLPLRDVYGLHRLFTQSYGPHSVRFQGVCTSMSTVSKQVYARHVRCCFCEAEGDHLEGQLPTCCIKTREQLKGCEEDLSCRQYVAVQQIWVGSLVPDLTDPFTVRASAVLVQLTEEDLCSSVSIGDIVDVVGQASLSHQAGKVNSKLLGDVQVVANNLSVVQLSGLQAAASAPHASLSLRQHTLLTSLCDSLQSCLNYPVAQDLLLALLLSAVSAGVPTTAPTQTNDAAVRNQVHVMVRSEGHDPSLTRTLKEAAHSLSGLNAVHSPSLGPLLPETTKMECGTVFVDLQAVRVSAGSLASMNRGILLLSSVDIKKGEKDALGSALNQGCFDLKEAPSVHVPATAAVWVVQCGDSAVKGKGSTPISMPASDNIQGLMQRTMQDMGVSLFNAFDLVLSHGHGNTAHDQDNIIESILDRAASHRPDSAASAAASATRRQAAQNGSRKEGVSRELKQRVAQGSSMTMPCIGPEAMMMVQQYYALLRQQSHGDGQLVSGMDAGSHTVASLLRMATACARLHMRNDVIAVPDAMLAIYLLQESMKAKGGKVVDQLDMSSVYGPCFTQSLEVCAISIEDKLKHMHNFMVDYVGNTAMEE